jgi:hypothetical protein
MLRELHAIECAANRAHSRHQLPFHASSRIHADSIRSMSSRRKATKALQASRRGQVQIGICT